MTTEELQTAYAQQQRELVAVNLGQVSLRPTISQGGAYNVTVKGTSKENSFTQLSKAFNQLPQLAGQFKNIQQQAGIEKVQAMDPQEIKTELQNRADGGDEEAKGFIYDLFQKESVDEELYRQVLKMEVIPHIQKLESELANASPNMMNEILNSENPVEEIERRYQDAVPKEVQDMVANSPHQLALHNEMLRRIPGLSGQSYAKLIENRSKFNDSSARDSILNSSDPFIGTNGNDEMPSQLPDDPDQFVAAYNSENGQIGPAGNSMLPAQVIANPSDAALSSETKPVLARVPAVTPPEIPASVSAVVGGKGATLEAFATGETDFVSVTGNPSQRNKNIILKNVTYTNDAGEQMTFNNVPVEVQKGSKTTPLGVFGITTDGTSSNINADSSVQGADPIDPSITPPVIKITPTEEVDFSRATITKERNDFAQRIANSDSSKLQKGNEAINKGIITPTTIPQWRKQVESTSLGEIQANIEENLNVVDTFLENIKSGKLKLDGKRYSNAYIVSLQQMINREEKRQETTDESFGEEFAKEELINISDILINKTDRPTEDNIQELKDSIVRAEELYKTGQIGKKEREEIREEADRSLEILVRYGDGVDVDFYASIPETDGILNSLGLRELLANYGRPDALVEAWRSAGRDVTGLQLTDDSYTEEKIARWNTILFKEHIQSASIANDRSRLDVIKEYKQRDIRKPLLFNIPRMVEGEEQGVMSIKEFYRERFAHHYKDVASEVADETLAELNRRNEAKFTAVSGNELERRSGVTPQDSPEVARQKQLKTLEVEKGDTDFIDEKGRIVLKGLFQKSETRLDQFNETASDPHSQKLFVQSNSLATRQKEIQNVYASTWTGSYPREQQLKIQNANSEKDFITATKIRAEFIKRSQYIGIPMELHRNGGQLPKTERNPRVDELDDSGFHPLLSGIYDPSDMAAVDLTPTGRDEQGNPLPPLYSRKVTSKTYVYNYTAARNAAKGEFQLLDELHKLYFPAEKDSLSKQEFRDNQIKLAREIGFGSPAPETTTK